MFKEIKLEENTDKNSNKLLLIYTGGTLGMLAKGTNDAMEALNFEEIIEYIPEIKKLNSQLSIAALERPIDSSDMNSGYWIKIGEKIFKNYNEYDGFVIIHGTDTMAYTAAALSYMFENLDKPIILTGSQMPLGLSRSDARNNLITSLEIAGMQRNSKPLITEVCVFFNNFLLRGNRAKKIESDQFDAFHSENFPVLAEAGVDIDIHEHYLWKTINDGKVKFNNRFSSDVINWKIFPGMRVGGISDVYINAGFKGIIIETYGSGNAPTDENFLSEIKKLINKGVYILNVSQCLGGSVKQGRYATSKKLDEFGVISGKDITSEAAIVKMMYLLANFKDEGEIRHLLKSSIRGELTI